MEMESVGEFDMRPTSSGESKGVPGLEVLEANKDEISEAIKGLDVESIGALREALNTVSLGFDQIASYVGTADRPDEVSRIAAEIPSMASFEHYEEKKAKAKQIAQAISNL